jgi:hypothetical protein
VVLSLLVVLSVALLPNELRSRSSGLVHTSKLYLLALVRTIKSFPESSTDRDQRCSIRSWTEYVLIKFPANCILMHSRARLATIWGLSSAESSVSK